MRYLFQLGHQPQISAAEIAAVFTLKHINTATLQHKNTKTIGHKNDFLILDTGKQLNCEELMDTLGGTIKIAMRVNGDISTYLNKTQPTGKIVFSLLDKKAAMKIKKELRQAGRSVRYVEPGNTATIFYNNLIKSGGDLTIIGNEVLATQAIQPFEDFSARDYKRPSS
ncbi:MAG: hypothetical protein HY980_00660, partial [Candidatus Magasanikbacteria bacterium]|nr:hypothetical protein [Candidatus Magasanikbacteria bacterium]